MLRELAPVWWVARAYVAVEALAMITGQGAADVAEYSRYAEVPRLGSPAVGLLVLAVATVASIAAGIAARRNPGRSRGALVAVNAVLVLVAIPVADELADAASLRFPAGVFYGEAAAQQELPPGLSYNGVAIDNVYPYNRAGRLLQDVRLYDSSGQPLDLGRDFANTNRRKVRDAQGASVFNAFPIRYFEPGTNQVTNPQAGPPIAASRITTPPLDAGANETTSRPTPTPTPAPTNETTPPPTSTPTPAPTNEPR